MTFACLALGRDVNARHSCLPVRRTQIGESRNPVNSRKM